MEGFNYAIFGEGDIEKNKEIIQLLKDNGGNETNEIAPNEGKDSAYFVNKYGFICSASIALLEKNDWTIISLDSAKHLSRTPIPGKEDKPTPRKEEKPSEDIFLAITKEMNELHARKNADYGNAYHNMLDFAGTSAGVGIMYNKLSRLSNLLKNDTQQVKDESIEDTLLDLANYAVMTLEYLKKK